MRNRRSILIYCLAHSSMLWAGPYQQLTALAARRKITHRQEGLSYIAGGSIALGGALALDIRSHEALPKLGYGLIQILSSAAISHGAILYFTKDELMTKVENLQYLDRQLQTQHRVTVSERSKILDQLASHLISVEREREEKIRMVRGTLQLVSAATATLSLLLSKTDTSSQLALGFVALVGTAGGMRDLLIHPQTETPEELFSFSPLLGQDLSPMISMAYRW